MTFTMTITPIENVDYENKQLKDHEKVWKTSFYSDEDINIYDTVTGNQKNIKVINVSLYDHRLILENNQYHILHMLSRINPHFLGGDE